MGGLCSGGRSGNARHSCVTYAISCPVLDETVMTENAGGAERAESGDSMRGYGARLGGVGEEDCNRCVEKVPTICYAGEKALSWRTGCRGTRSWKVGGFVQWRG